MYVLIPTSFFNWDISRSSSFHCTFYYSVMQLFTMVQNMPHMSHCHRFFTFDIDLVFPTWVSTSSFITFSAQLIFTIYLQHHFSKALRNLLSVSFITHVSQPYTTILCTKVFRNVFFFVWLSIRSNSAIQTHVYYAMYKL